MKLYPFVSLFISLTLFLGCNKENLISKNTTIEMPAGGEVVVEAQNRFAFNLFKEVLKQDGSGQNILVSPLSIFMDLSMVQNGARENTLAEIKGALLTTDIGQELINSVNKSLLTGLPKADPKVELNIANSIWYRNDGYQPIADFLNINSQNYLAKIAAANFNNQATVDEINQWVSDQTRNKIQKIIDNINPEDIMYLINAVYFKGQWKLQFNKNETRDDLFHPDTGDDVSIPFMKQKATFNYSADDTKQVVELPYGNEKYSMYLILPSGTETPATLLSSLNEESFRSLVNGMDSTKFDLLLPKWEYRYEINNLKPQLSALGIKDAFNDNADLTGMYPAEARAYISKAIHKTYIAVDEEGTEAAAVTSIGISTTSVGISEPQVVKFDRPFFYVIAEKGTGAILFLGIVNNLLPE